VCGLSSVNGNKTKCFVQWREFFGQRGDCRLSGKALYHGGNWSRAKYVKFIYQAMCGVRVGGLYFI
jgi:hypothetical protein